jgi:hypothetical protein
MMLYLSSWYALLPWLELTPTLDTDISGMMAPLLMLMSSWMGGSIKFAGSHRSQLPIWSSSLALLLLPDFAVVVTGAGNEADAE